MKLPTIRAYLDSNCAKFEDLEHNKLEYTQIHDEYKQLVDDLLTLELSELALTSSQFERFLERCLSTDTEMCNSLRTQLLSTDDFMVFKAMMIRRKSEFEASAPHQYIEEPADQLPLPDIICDTDLPVARMTVAEEISCMDLDVSRNEANLNTTVESKPVTLLERQRQASLPARACDCAGIKTEQDCKQFYLYKPRNYLDGALPESEALSFGTKPEPWLAKEFRADMQIPAAFQGAPDACVEPTVEERKQRQEYWRRQRDILRRNRTGAAINTDPHVKACEESEGSRLASELRCSSDFASQGPLPVDASAMRQALTRHLRTTFDQAKQ